MVRAVALLVVAVLVVLAGCGSFTDDETAREPFAVETTSTATATANTTQAPVVAFDPLYDTAPDPFVLVNAHSDALEDEPYAVTYRSSLTHANGTVIERLHWTTTYEANRTRYRQVRNSTYRNRSVTRELYANGTHFFSRSGIGDGNATVRLVRGSNGKPMGPADALVRAAPSTIRSALAVMNVTGVRSLDATPSDLDEPLYVVTMNETSVADPYGNETLNASLTLYVTERGRIVEFIHTYTFVRNGATIQGFEHVLFHAVERSPVERPEWATTNTTSIL